MRTLSGLLAAFALVSTACSTAQPMAAAEYFPTIEAELTRLDQATKDLTGRYATELENRLDELLATVDMAAAGAAEAVLIEILSLAKVNMQAIIESHTSQLAVFADRIGELTPPDAVATGHRELVDAFATWSTTAPETVALLAAAEDLAGLASAIAGTPYADAQLRVDLACRALEDNAAAVQVTLSCPGTQLDLLEVTP